MTSLQIIVIVCLIFTPFAYCFNVFEEYNKVTTLVSNKGSGPLGNGCQCIQNDCGCCEYLKWESVGIDGSVCTNITYLPQDYGISVTLMYNNYVLYNETVSARNPPPMCFGIPELEKFSAEICLKLYDLAFGKTHFHGCLEVKVVVYHIIHKTVNVGCIDLPTHSNDNIMSIYSTKNNEVQSVHSFNQKQYDKKEKIFPSVNMI